MPTVRHARRLENEGADALIVSGAATVGHVGKVAMLPLIPMAVDAVRIPVSAAGGFFDGRGLVAALALGAQGIQMGTCFLATQESSYPSRYKERIVGASDEDTVVSRMLTGKPVRVLCAPAIDEWNAAEARGASKDELRTLRWELRRRAFEQTDLGNVVSGQAAGGIHDVPTVAEFIRRIVTQARPMADDMASLSSPRIGLCGCTPTIAVLGYPLSECGAAADLRGCRLKAPEGCGATPLGEALLKRRPAA